MIVNLPHKGQKGFQSVPITERFWTKVQKTETCWLWGASKNKWGYGWVKLNGSMRGAHRVSYELTKGQIPNGFEILHKCDNPPCVNPDHLSSGTHGDNIRDMFKKGRGSPRGRKNV